MVWIERDLRHLPVPTHLPWTGMPPTRSSFSGSYPKFHGFKHERKIISLPQEDFALLSPLIFLYPSKKESPTHGYEHSWVNVQLAINLTNFSKRCSALPISLLWVMLLEELPMGNGELTPSSLPSLSANRDAHLVYLSCVILLSSSLISIIIIIAIMNNLCQLSNLQDYSDGLWAEM